MVSAIKNVRWNREGCYIFSSWRGSKKNLLVRNQKDVYHLKYNNVFNGNYGHIDRIHASI